MLSLIEGQSCKLKYKFISKNMLYDAAVWFLNSIALWAFILLQSWEKRHGYDGLLVTRNIGK